MEAADPPLMEELVEEVLLRFPPGDPARLVAAALVCRRWCSLLAGPGFRRRFRELHRAPPLLGLLCNSGTGARFLPACAFRPPGLPRSAILRGWFALDARHGRVLLRWDHPGRDAGSSSPALVVWDPVTEQRKDLPPLLWAPYPYSWNAAVLCAAGAGCDHLDCCGGHFLVVVVGTNSKEMFAYIYSSEANAWSEPASARHPNDSVDFAPSALVGNALYFALQMGTAVLEYDLGTKQLAVIRLPLARFNWQRIALTATTDGRLGFATADRSAIYLWSREASPVGDAPHWAQTRVIELNKLLPAGSLSAFSDVVGFVDAISLIFVRTGDGLFTVDLKSSRVTKVSKDTGFSGIFPYMSFHTPALGVPSAENHHHTIQQQYWNDGGLEIHYSDFQILSEHVLIPNAQHPDEREQMEILLSAVLGELITRSIDFFISKRPQPPALDVEDRLQRVLLRAQVIIEEAMVRQITNQAMLQQLDMLRDTMYRGCYLLDTFRFQSYKEDAKDQIVSHPSLLSKLNSVKDFCFPSGEGTQILEEILDVLDSLRSIILDANEMVVFLTSYTRMYREPYSMHLLLGKCMFGRQMEAQHVINFLLHTRPGAAEGLEVLPIVGPFRVGKSTLVAHVCNDGRVHDYFSEIVFLSDHDFRDEKLTTFREGCVMKYQNCVSNKNGRVLVVVELAGDFSEGDWKRLYSASKRYLPSGSKIIITSRSDNIKKLGTTRAITLKFLSCEEYWYYIRTLAFGSADPKTYPRLAHLAMEIARAMKGTFIGANITACVLRDNFNIRFWLKVRALLRGIIQKNVSRFGGHPLNRVLQNRPAPLGRMATPSEDLVLCSQYQCSSQEEAPKIKMQDVMYGSVKPRGKFDVLAWKSPIPPYYSYVFTCEIQQLETTGAKRKHSMIDGVTYC